MEPWPITRRISAVFRTVACAFACLARSDIAPDYNVTPCEKFGLKFPPEGFHGRGPRPSPRRIDDLSRHSHGTPRCLEPALASLRAAHWESSEVWAVSRFILAFRSMPPFSAERKARASVWSFFFGAFRSDCTCVEARHGSPAAEASNETTRWMALISRAVAEGGSSKGEAAAVLHFARG
ncbi:hypothetical protein VUR80DRAFT_6475 [Thermomyces stellatus]